MAKIKAPSLLVPGLSSTGSKHDLLIEITEDGFKFTVVGVGGKRHAAAHVLRSQGEDVTAFIAKHQA